MLIKYFLYLLMIYITLSTELFHSKELKKYGRITVYYPTLVYLSLDGYDIGDKIHIYLDFEYNFYKEFELLYRLSDSHSTSEDYDSSNFEKSHRDSDYYNSERYYTFYYTIKLNKKTKYLLLITPLDFTDKLIVTHVNKMLYIFLGTILLFLMIFCIIVFIYNIVRKRCLKNKNLPKLNYPNYYNFPNYISYP